MNNISKHKFIWVAISVLSFLCAAVGVVHVEIYDNVVQKDIIPGAFGQDLITIVVSIFLFVIALKVKKDDIKLQTITIGLLGYLFYAYGLYTIEQTYNFLYLIYLLIFGAVFWELVFIHFSQYWLTDFKIENTQKIKKLSIVVAFIQPVIFYPLWIMALIPLLRNGDRIENLYSVYIIDLCFIMPAFLIVAIEMLREKIIGYILAPAMFILGGFLIFSLAVSEFVKPIFDEKIKIGAVIISLLLSAVFVFSAISHLKNIKFVKNS